MITLRELLGRHEFRDLIVEHQDNMMILLARMSQFRGEYNKPMVITSGFRTLEDHVRIYQTKGVPLSEIPMGSKHLSGQACDVLDKNGSLFRYCKDNVLLLTTIGLWCEEKDDQPRVHFQTVAPSSGKRFFVPRQLKNIPLP